MNRLHVAVLMGGPSAEREVSLQSGAAAVAALRNAGMHVSPVDVKDEDFHLPAGTDVAFLALHGTFGEDGQVQRILEQRGVPYTGSGPEASARAFDKARAKKSFIASEIPTPQYVVLEKDVRPLATMKLPVVVKPARQGSSVGVTLVMERAGLDRAIEQAWRYSDKLVVEEFIEGREFTVAVFDGGPLPIVEIRTKNQFFDKEAKYTPGGAEEICPAGIDAALTREMQKLGCRAHECLSCRDVSRTDVMMSKSGELYVLEVNTLPGMTATSLLPKAAQAAGMSMEDVCTRLVEMAMARCSAAVAA